MQYFSNWYDYVFAKIMSPGKSSAPNPLFIWGSGRNGSTLLSCILNNHRDIFIPPEHRMIPDIIRYEYSHPFSSWEKKVNQICDQLSKPSQWKIDSIALKEELMAFLVSQRNPSEIIHFIYRMYGKVNQKEAHIWGDKSPANTHFVYLITKQFPQSKIIFLLRDHRDVIASHLKVSEAYYSIRFDFLLWYWKNAVRKYEKLHSRTPEAVRLLRYEQLVKHPQKEVDSINHN